MGRHSDRARGALMDSAEELFARHGIDAVSNRRITEHAGTANHSAVAYHFGTRDQLILAMVDRHLSATAERRAQRLATLGDDAGLRDLVTAGILPVVEVLDALPVPSWRARFLRQARSVPSVVAVLATRAAEPDGLAVLARHTPLTTDEGSRKVMQARIGIVSHLVFGVCAEYEARREDNAEEGTWLDVGYFLVDSVVGLLTAPVTHRSSYLPRTAVPGLV
ncbi:MAG: TetR/AcrR family transcriptional regulator [Dietzia sp.]